MELTLISLPLLAALAAGPFARAFGEIAASIIALLLGAVAAILAGLLALGAMRGAREPVFIGGWFESGTLSAEILFRTDAFALSASAFAAVFVFALQAVGMRLKTPAPFAKFGESKRARFQCLLSLIGFALIWAALSGGLVTLVAGLVFVAVAISMALDFNFLSQNAGRAAARGLLITFTAALLAMAAAAFVYQQADGDSFEPVMSLAAEIAAGPQATALAWGVALAALALAAALPFYPWSADAADTAPEMAAALQVLPPLAAILLIERLAPFSASGLVGPLWLCGGTALIAALAAATTGSVKRALGALSLGPVALALLVALSGAPALALILLAVHAGVHTLLWLAYGALIQWLDGDCDLRAMGGLKRSFPAAHLAAFIATLAGSGFGVPVIYGAVPLAMSGFVAQQSALGLAFAGGQALFGLLFTALMLQAFALWRLYLAAFQGALRSRKHLKEASEPHVAPLFERVAYGVLIAAAIAMGAAASALFGLPAASEPARTAPLFAFAIGLLAALFFAKFPKLARLPDGALAFYADFTGLVALYGKGLGAVVAALGAFFAQTLDRRLFDALFDPLSRWLLPKLGRSAGQAQAARGFRFVLGFLVLALLVVTMVTMAGG
ncbi:MAG: proton-conducting transporter membrane subunit [Pseudomonadota bacterium]